MMKYFMINRPTFLSGMGRVLDIGTTLNEYNFGLTSEMTDSIAMNSDWDAVGVDIHEAMIQYERSIQE